MKPLVLLLVVFLAQALAQQVPTKPFLRIEAQMHTAPISRIAVDSSQTYLITGSYDKTVRVWELKTGNLVKVLRVPIDEGKEGEIYAVALSPNGRHLAVGGWTGHWDGETFAVYIFDLKTGKIIKSIKGFPEVITALSYSKDGKYLAVGLGGGLGLRVFSVPDYKLIFRDEDYRAGVYHIDFSKDGKLVVSALDTLVRLYDKNFRLLQKSVHFIIKPYQVSFSADGTKIAVSFGGAPVPAVVVYSALDLRFLYGADTSNFEGCRFFSVSFSEGYLYAGGDCGYGADTIIRIWIGEGKGKYKDVRVSQNTVFHILPVKGGVVFGTTDPAFGMLTHDGRILLKREPVIADFRGQCGKMLLSSDGSSVGFGYTWRSDPTVVFDAKEFRLKDVKQVSGLEEPLMDHPNIHIENWEDNLRPHLNGEPISLEKNEVSRCYAIAPDGSGFVLGTDLYVRYYDSMGNLLWSVPVRGAWSVGISSNGRVVVAGLGDGTIRWYRASDGKELLALFPHRDGKRWVLWTPESYYVASEGGEELIGWHINKSADKEADFVPLSKFKTQFNKPEVIRKLFTTYDIRKALELTGVQALEVGDVAPPTVSILSPEDGSTVSSTNLTLKVKAK